VDPEFGEAAMAILAGDAQTLESLLAVTPELATQMSSVGHPTLLQLIACEAAELPDPVSSARVLVDAGAAMGPPLVAAAGCGSRSVLNFLLSAGSAIDGDMLWTPLDEAIYWAQFEIVALLMERGAVVRALSTAAGLGDLTAIDRFFDGERLLASAGPIGSPFPDTVSDALAHDDQSIVDHAFVMAVNAGQPAAAQGLLQRGAAVNSKPPGFHWQGTALHAAVWRGDAALVEWLMSAGADPSVRDGLVDSDAFGWATHRGQHELTAILSRRPSPGAGI